MTRYSILDLAPVPEGSRPGDALRNTIDLARHADRLGFTRYWLAEHHNMVGIASAATAVVIGQVAAATSRIRVGAGGIMLPNHAPMIIAEQFGTLAELFPGRIDLGLGRAPGTDQMTLRALRVNPMEADRFPDDVLELQALLAEPQPGQTLRAVPGFGTNVPLWVLGSSLFGAQLAAAFGLPYAFASHFAPDALMQAFQVYRAQFRSSEQPGGPYAMAGINIIAADTDAEANRLFSSAQQRATMMVRGTRGYLPPPIDTIESFWSPSEKTQVDRMLACSIVGGPETLRRGLEAFIARTGADELMVAAAIFDHGARLESYAIVDEVARDLGLATGDVPGRHRPIADSDIGG
jgi:luciferase family oxidoreductase group 1